MTIIDMVRIAYQELGLDSTDEQLQSFLWERFCKAIELKYVPVYRATLRGEVQLKEARENAAIVLRQDSEIAEGKKRRTA